MVSLEYNGRDRIRPRMRVADGELDGSAQAIVGPTFVGLLRRKSLARIAPAFGL
jgi:hypothetical protein